MLQKEDLMGIDHIGMVTCPKCKSNQVESGEGYDAYCPNCDIRFEYDEKTFLPKKVIEKKIK